MNPGGIFFAPSLISRGEIDEGRMGGEEMLLVKFLFLSVAVYPPASGLFAMNCWHESCCLRGCEGKAYIHQNAPGGRFDSMRGRPRRLLSYEGTSRKIRLLFFGRLWPDQQPPPSLRTGQFAGPLGRLRRARSHPLPAGD